MIHLLLFSRANASPAQFYQLRCAYRILGRWISCDHRTLSHHQLLTQKKLVMTDLEKLDIIIAIAQEIQTVDEDWDMNYDETYMAQRIEELKEPSKKNSGGRWRGERNNNVNLSSNQYEKSRP